MTTLLLASGLLLLLPSSLAAGVPAGDSETRGPASWRRGLRATHSMRRAQLSNLRDGSFLEVDEERSPKSCRGGKEKRLHKKYNSWCDEAVGLFNLNGKMVRSQWCLSQPEIGLPTQQCSSQSKFKQCTFMFTACKAVKSAAKKCCVGYQEPQCNGQEAQWQVTALDKCKQKFGEKSVWNSELDHCKGIWKNCIDGAEATCCTQPEGAKNLEDYCANQEQDEGAEPDPACQVAPMAQDLQGQLVALPTNLDAVNGSAAALAAAAAEGGNLTAAALASGPAAAALASGPAAAGPSAAGPAAAVAAAPADAAAAGPAAAAAAAPADAAAAGTEAEPPADGFVAVAAAPAGANTSAPSGPGVAAAESSALDATLSPAEREAACNLLNQKMDKIRADVNNLVAFKKAKLSAADAVNHDPELNAKLERCVEIGKEMPTGTACVIKQPETEGDNVGDDDDDDSEADSDADGALQNVETTMRDTLGLKGSKKRLDMSMDLKPVVSLDTGMMDRLLVWALRLNATLHDLETGVHPHGCKWWRYRYQYTVVEAIILAMLYPIMFGLTKLLMACGRWSGALQERQKTKHPKFMYHYAYLALVFHSTAVAFMQLVAWGLWWSTYFWDFFAVVIRSTLGNSTLGKKHLVELPFLGDSYYWMTMEILFHILGGFVLFTLLVLLILRNYVNSHDTWKHLGKVAMGEEVASMEYPKSVADHYEQMVDAAAKQFEALAAREPSFAQTLAEVGVTTTTVDMHRLKFYRYLTVALNTSSAVLTMPSLVAVLVMLVYFFVSLFLALCYRLPWFFFIGPFLVCTIIVMILAWLASIYIQRSVLDPKRTTAVLPWLTITGFSITIQVLLLLLCYSFTRLIFSQYVWRYFFWLGVTAIIGFLAVFLAIWLLGSEICKKTVCALALPPQCKTPEVEADLTLVAKEAEESERKKNEGHDPDTPREGHMTYREG